LQPAYPNDRVIVRTWVATMGKVQSTRRYQMIRSQSTPPDQDSPSNPRDVVLVVAHTDWAYIDFVTRTPKRIPRDMASCFRIVADQ
jgi:acyl-CoA thioester hydrolase